MQNKIVKCTMYSKQNFEIKLYFHVDRQNFKQKLWIGKKIEFRMEYK